MMSNGKYMVLRRQPDLMIDLHRNQEDFPKAAWNALKTLSTNGKLGDAELMLLYSFRDKNGEVDGGM